MHPETNEFIATPGTCWYTMLARTMTETLRHMRHPRANEAFHDRPEAAFGPAGADWKRAFHGKYMSCRQQILTFGVFPGPA